MSDDWGNYEMLEVTTFGDREPVYVRGKRREDRAHVWRCQWCGSEQNQHDQPCAQCGAPRVGALD
jgi:rubrerythrin